MANPDKSDKMRELLKDLGKPTLRGVKKCPNCGTYNGIRGLSCKNKACNMVLRGAGRKKGHSADAVKIITGSTVQVFSVRLRDRGPDYRGFVELPLNPEIDLQGQAVDPSILAHAGRCYVEMCNKPVSTSNTAPVLPCNHIKLTIECDTEATPLTLKNSVLNVLPVSNEIKQAIWLLATETTGPLVQRVSKNVVVVKCKVQPKHPLGFLHFSFTETPRKGSFVEHKFQCACKQFRNYRITAPGDELKRRCVHFYACICAFASDEILAKEFEFYIQLDSVERTITVVETGVVTDVENTGQEQQEQQQQLKRKRKDDTIAQASSALLTLQDSAAMSVSTIITSPIKRTNAGRKAGPPSVSTITTPNKNTITMIPVDDMVPAITFSDWLGSVTERINQTMHYQFDGTPEPLVFHVPQVFFDSLQQRISAGSKKKRLPNSTTAFIRKDALPLGTFSKYTWHLTNVLHVKQIFDTPDRQHSRFSVLSELSLQNLEQHQRTFLATPYMMPLEVTRSFMENRHGMYTVYNAPKVEVENIREQYKKPDGQIHIKPFELKTYLKVGNTAADQKEPTPFIIEWIPDILPKSKIGELRIKFEYGHQRNGHVEHRPQAPSITETVTVTEEDLADPESASQKLLLALTSSTNISK